MESAKAALASGDYSAANEAYTTAREKLDELTTMKKAEGTNWLFILLVLVALGVFGYAGWNYYKKKQAEKPEPKKELPKAEDQYRTEYY